MKKLGTIAALAVLFSFSACEKEKQVITIEQTLEKTIKSNESATFTLPKNESDDAYRITTDATHAFVSKLGEDLSGNELYLYTPEKDYVGSDLIVVSTIDERYQDTKHPSKHKNLDQKSGGCHGEKTAEQHQKVTILLTILKADASTPILSEATELN